MQRGAFAHLDPIVCSQPGGAVLQVRAACDTVRQQPMQQARSAWQQWRTTRR
jgi:hypothetical protein